MGGKDGCKGRPEAATISDILYLLILVREIIFLSGKSQGKVREFWKLMSVATMEGDYGYFCYCEGDVLFQRWVWEFFLNNHMYMYVIFSWCSYTFLLIFTIGMSLQQYILILIWCGIPRRMPMVLNKFESSTPSSRMGKLQLETSQLNKTLVRNCNFYYQ